MKITDKESALKAIRAKGFEPIIFDDEARNGRIQFCGWRLAFSMEDTALIMFGGDDIIPYSKACVLGEPWGNVVALVERLPDRTKIERKEASQ